MQKFKTLFAFVCLGILLGGLVWSQRAPESISIRILSSESGTVSRIEINGEPFAWQDHQLKQVWARLEVTASTMPPGPLDVRVQADERLLWSNLRRVLQSVVLMRPDMELTVMASPAEGLVTKQGVRLHTVNPAHLDPYDQIPNLPNERRLKIFLRREASGGTTAIFLTEIFMVEDYLGTGEHARNVLTRNLDELRSHPRVAPVIDEVYVEVRPEPGVSWGEILKTLHIAQGVPGSDGQPNSRFQLIGLEGIHYEEAP